MDALGSAIGANPSQTSSLLNAAGPAVLGGMADRAEQPGGAGALMGMLGSGGLPSAGNLGSFFSGGDSKAGSSMLEGIFGGNQSGLVDGLASQTGLGSGLIGKALPMIAPVIMSVVAKRASDDGLDESGLTRLLGSERAALEKKGLFSKGMLGAAAAGAAGMGVAGATAGKMTGAAGDATAAMGSMSGKAAGKMTGAAGDATAAMGSMSGKARNSVSAGASKVGGTVDKGISAGGAAGGPGKGGLGWLWWILGALVALAIAAWLLSQCGGDAADVVEDTAGDAAEVVEETAEDVEEATDDGIDVDALQADVDGTLTGTGVTGVAADDGSVTLTGEVATEEDRQGAEAAVAAVAGVTSVDNQITVAAAEEEPAEEEPAEEEPAEEEPAEEEPAEEEPAEEPAEEEPAEEPATVNEQLDLDPITFDVNSANITPEGQAVLDQAAEFFTANADVAVEIAGHTDADGDEGSNLTLSQARAESVRAYLVGKGIDEARMTPVGYGETEPIADNETPEGKAENRRIEFRIQ